MVRVVNGALEDNLQLYIFCSLLRRGLHLRVCNFAFDIELGAFLTINVDDADQPSPNTATRVPFGLSCVSPLWSYRANFVQTCDKQVCDLAAITEGPNFRGRSDIPIRMTVY